MESEIDVNLERQFCKNGALATAGARFFGSRGPNLEAKVYQKSITTWSSRWNACWHRFLSDVGGFLEPNCEAKSTKNPPKKVSTKMMQQKKTARNLEKWSRRSAIWLSGRSALAGTRATRRGGRVGRGTGKKTCVCDLTRRRPEAWRIS